MKYEYIDSTLNYSDSTIIVQSNCEIRCMYSELLNPCKCTNH